VKLLSKLFSRPIYRYDHLNRYDDAIKILFTFRQQDRDFWHVVHNMVLNDTLDERLAIAEAFRALSIKMATDMEYFRNKDAS